MNYVLAVEGRLKDLRRAFKIPLVWPFRQKVALRTKIRVVELRERLESFLDRLVKDLQAG